MKLEVHHCPHPRERGFTIVELMFGLMIFVIGAVVLINHVTINFQSTLSQRDRVFAYTKAQGILAEVQSFVDRGGLGETLDLDSLDDGVLNKPSLTITRNAAGILVPADHEISGNFQRNGNWMWSRRITVQPFPGLSNRNVRYVTVRVYKRDQNNNEHAVADLSTVVNSPGSAFPTTEVFDIYFLAVENIPGWWVYMEAIRPFVESTVTDLETRNPGLEVRTHWITKAAYGRNAGYRPRINLAVDSHTPTNEVYYYPGLMPAGSSSTFYYVPETMKARMSFDGTERNGYDADTNPYPYALADFYNHTMRYPREKALHEIRVAEVEKREAEIAADILGGLTPRAPLVDMSAEPTLRLFLEDLNTDPNKYGNALIINLHGELLPMPALRNYSDAAKNPENLPGVRVVTHPEELRTLRDPVGTAHDDVVLRVYGYKTDPTTGPQVMPDNMPISLEVMGMDLTDDGGPELDADVEIECLTGGVPVGGTSDYFPFSPAPTSPPDAGHMYYEAEFVNPGAGQQKFTRILLYNTPVVAPSVDNRGLNSNTRSRLYNLEYVPACTEDAVDFSRDLYTAGNRPKNTARWTIRIPGDSFPEQRFVDLNGTKYEPITDVVLSVRTRIWDPGSSDPQTTGTMFPPAARNQPDNFSETYTWWADSREDVPITERSQFLGDPRHNPYKDLLDGDPDYPNGYNWYFDTLRNDGDDSVQDYPGLDRNRLENRWEGRMRADVPRFMELLRGGLVSSGAVYTTLTGFSYYYMGHGNEIGYDSANGYPDSIPAEMTAFGAPGSTDFVNNITGNRRFVRNLAANYWWGMTWLGELYPDSAYTSQWMALDGDGNPRGNLDAGTGAGQFFRWQDNVTYSGSTYDAYATAVATSIQRTQREGCTSFFNIGSSGSTFHHQFAGGGTGNLVGAGLQLATNYNFPMPTTAPISRPFNLAASGSGGVGDEWNFNPYSGARYAANMVQVYYDHSTGNIGSGLVELIDPGNTSSAYIVVNGIDKTVESGSSFIAKYSMLTLVHSFFEAGNPALAHRIQQPPRVEINAPTDITELIDPASIAIQFDTSWTRWDGVPYTAATPLGFAELENEIEYVIMYSRDGGTNWLHVQDDSVAMPGVKPTSGLYLVADTGIGEETFAWSTPSVSFPEGTYLLVVEAYRKGQSLHYSYHKVRIFIGR